MTRPAWLWLCVLAVSVYAVFLSSNLVYAHNCLEWMQQGVLNAPDCANSDAAQVAAGAATLGGITSISVLGIQGKGPLGPLLRPSVGPSEVTGIPSRTAIDTDLYPLPRKTSKRGPDGKGPPRLTLYVDDSDMVGHTFVSLTDSNGNRITKGVFDASETPDAGLLDNIASFLGWHKARVRDDSGHGWSVRTTYEIDKDGYDRAIAYIKQHERDCAEGKVNYGAVGWRVAPGKAENCNIFAREVMKQAGLDMPESGGFERPANVADALNHLPGSEQHSEGYGTDVSHKPKPASQHNLPTQEELRKAEERDAGDMDSGGMAG